MLFAELGQCYSVHAVNLILSNILITLLIRTQRNFERQPSQTKWGHSRGDVLLHCLDVRKSCTAASFKWLWNNEWTVHTFMVLETTWMVCQLIELLIIIIICECNRFYYGLLFLAMTFHYTKNKMLLELQYKLCQRTDSRGNRINGNELNCVAIRSVATNQIAWQLILLPQLD